QALSYGRGAVSVGGNVDDRECRRCDGAALFSSALCASSLCGSGIHLDRVLSWRQPWGSLAQLSDTLSGLNFSNGNNNGVFIGGGQVGFNWQVSNFVLGFEWDIDGAGNNNNTGTVFVPALGTIQVTSNNRWITTLAARFGVTNGPWLFYGKAGGGWVGNDDFTINNLTTS